MLQRKRDSNLIKNIPSFWGDRFRNKKIISYAGSVGNTSAEIFEEFPYLPKYVNRWSAVSVRDKHTYDIISGMTTENVEIVCDPTMLLCRSDYEKMLAEENIVKPEGGYIFLYLFAKLTDQQMKELSAFAKSKSLRIINGVGVQKGSMVDENIVNSPYNFLRYMLHADYVVTDTFHGTIFAVNLEKQFVSLNRGKNKVNEFLSFAGFDDRLVDTNDSIIKKMMVSIDFNSKMNRIAEQRKQSMDFLQRAIFKQ